MVRRSGFALAGLLWSLGAAASAADWDVAGGDLFVRRGTPGPIAAGPEAGVPGEGGSPPVRLTPPVQPFAEVVTQAAQRHGLDPKLLHALVAVESAYRPRAVSRAGAAGLTQLMPAAARDLGVGDRFDPAANLQGGADYLAQQLRRFGDLRLALAAYNAGPARVARLGRIPEIAETRAYVQAVVECYLALTAGRGVRGRADCRSAGDLS